MVENFTPACWAPAALGHRLRTALAAATLIPALAAVALTPSLAAPSLASAAAKHHPHHRPAHRPGRLHHRGAAKHTHTSKAHRSAPKHATGPVAGSASAAVTPFLTLGTDSAGTLTQPWQTYPVAAGPLVKHNVDGSFGLSTTATSAGPNDSEMTSVWVGASDAHAGWAPTGNVRVDRQSTWYHLEMKLPSGGYAPTTGDWNWLVEWHDDGHTAPSAAGPYSIALGIHTDWPVASGVVGQHPQLMLRLAGGPSAAPIYKTVTAPGFVQFDHNYDITFHFVWSHDASVGLVQWYLDGQQIDSENFPTLYTNPDGTASYNTFGIYNYHLAAPWTSTVEFSKVAIGPDQASVTQGATGA